MKQDRFRLIDSLLDRVLDVSTLEREQILGAECDDDRELREEVLSLLAAVKNSTEFIEKPLASSAKSLLEGGLEENLSERKIGAYRLKKLLGRGGMSAVYLASRTEDFQKDVAVKIIPMFENSLHSAENFRRERTILARLEHPNIARILDGGTADDGTPFLVMEYVDGVALDKYCKQKSLSRRERLVLFKDVCSAVSYAHQNLIVHRDLKPNNIFVKADGTVKLLDFGIAKLLDGDASETGENRTFDGVAFTPDYASPEQIGGETITTATDVYSLGVVLYEVLTGKRPFNLRGKPFGEMLKIVTTEEPSAPSARLRSDERELDADIDAIILKSLSKNPSERYPTVQDFCTDIDRSLKNLPVTARRQTFFYRLEKYVKRRRTEAIIGLLIFLLVFGWLATTFSQSRQAEWQAGENRRAAYSAEMILAANELENANLNRVKELIEKYRDSGDSEDLRGFEWHFLHEQLYPPAKIGTLSHPDEVWSGTYSPDGNLLATVCNDNFVRLWNVAENRVVAQTEQKGAWKIAFFPDGQRFAVSSSSNSAPLVKIYETATAREILAFRGHTRRVRALAVAPDGKSVASAAQDGNVIIWNADDGSEIKRFAFSTPQKGVEFFDLQFSRDGSKLVALGSETLVIFDTRTWSKAQADVQNFLDRNLFLDGWKVAFSPLEKTLAIGTYAGNVIFVDADTLEILRVLKLHQANVKSLLFSADGKTLITASGDRTVKFTDVSGGSVLGDLRGHYSGVHEIFFSPDGKTLATTSADFRVNLWNYEKLLQANSVLTGLATLAPDSEAEVIYGFNSINNETSAFSVARKTSLWTVKTELNVFSLALSESRGELLAGEREGYLTVINAGDGRIIKRFKPFEKTVFAVIYAPDSRAFYAIDESGTLKGFDALDGAEKFVVKAHADTSRLLNISPDGKRLVTGGYDKLVKIFDAENGAELLTMNDNSKPLFKGEFSPDGRYVAAVGADDVARIWNVADGSLWRKFSGMSGGIHALAFAPDGRRLATASDVGIVRLWNIASGEQVFAFTASQKQIVFLKFVNQGKSLVIADTEGRLTIWKTE